MGMRKPHARHDTKGMEKFHSITMDTHALAWALHSL